MEKIAFTDVSVMDAELFIVTIVNKIIFINDSNYFIYIIK